MAWYRQATNHYLSQFWHRSMLPYAMIRPLWVNWWSTEFILENMTIYILVFLKSSIGLNVLTNVICSWDWSVIWGKANSGPIIIQSVIKNITVELSNDKNGLISVTKHLIHWPLGFFLWQCRWVIFMLILVTDDWCISCEIAIRWM